MAAVCLALMVLRAALGAPQAVETEKRTRCEFEAGLDGWVSSDPERSTLQITRRPEDVQEGEGALEFHYPVEAGRLLALVNPGLHFAGAQGVRFWARTSEATLLVIVLQEEDGSRYNSVAQMAANRWQQVERGFAVFQLGGDSRDENAHLDLDQVVSVILGDVAPFLGAKPGERRLWIDSFEVAAEVSAAALQPPVFAAGTPVASAVQVRGGAALGLRRGTDREVTRELSVKADYGLGPGWSAKGWFRPDFSDTLEDADPQRQGLSKREDDKRAFFREDRRLFDDPLVLYASAALQDLSHVSRLQGRVGTTELGLLHAEMEPTGGHAGGIRTVLRSRTPLRPKVVLGGLVTRAQLEPRTNGEGPPARTSWTYGLDATVQPLERSKVVLAYARSATGAQPDGEAIRAEIRNTHFDRTEILLGYQDIGRQFLADAGRVPYGPDTVGYDLSISHQLTRKQIGLRHAYLTYQYARLRSHDHALATVARNGIGLLGLTRQLSVLWLVTGTDRGDHSTALSGGGLLYNSGGGIEAQALRLGGHSGDVQLKLLSSQVARRREKPLILRVKRQKIAIPPFNFRRRTVLWQLVYKFASQGLLRLEMQTGDGDDNGMTVKMLVPLLEL